jgi:hypothetical protein
MKAERNSDGDEKGVSLEAEAGNRLREVAGRGAAS